MLKAIRSKLWTRMAAVLLLATVTPVLAGGYFTLRELSDSIEEQARLDRETFAVLGQSLVDQFEKTSLAKLSSRGILLQDTLANTNVGVWSQENSAYQVLVQNSLNEFQQGNPEFLELRYYAPEDKKQTLVQVQGRADFVKAQQQAPQQQKEQTQEAQQQADLAWVKQVPGQSKNVQNYYGFPSRTIAAPLTQKGDITGVLIAFVDYNDIGKLLHPLAEHGYYISLHRHDGTLITDTGDEGIMTDSLKEKRVAADKDTTIEIH